MLIIDESAAGAPGFAFAQGALDALLTAMELRDAAAAAHARRVAGLATDIGRELLGPDSNLAMLRTAALLNDRG